MVCADKGTDNEKYKAEHLHAEAFADTHQRTGCTTTCDNHTDTEQDTAECCSYADWHYIALTRDGAVCEEGTILDGCETNRGNGKCN